jgi:four helix bundle protein
VVETIRRRDRDLADQLRRAATSLALNLAESRGSTDGNRAARLRTALGSTHETRAALRVAEAWCYVDARTVDVIDERLDRVAAMTWSLAHR